MGRKSSYYTKRTKKKKAIVKVCISYDLFEKVSKLAPEVYGTLRGGLSDAVEEGLRIWLARHTGALFGARQNPRPTVREYYNRVTSTLVNDMNVIPTTLPGPGLTAVVMRALDIKERAAVGWVFRFYVNGLIKPLKPPGIRLYKPSDVRRVKFWEIVAKEA